VPSDILDAVRKVSRHSERLEDELLLEGESASQMGLLQREKLQLLDKVAELEAETISSRARAQELQAELAALSAIRNGLEDRLRRAGLGPGEAGILVPGPHRIQPIEPTVPTALQSPRGGGTALNIRSKGSAFASVFSGAAASGRTNCFYQDSIALALLPAAFTLDQCSLSHFARLTPFFKKKKKKYIYIYDNILDVIRGDLGKLF
jgi:hypothetical protein